MDRGAAAWVADMNKLSFTIGDVERWELEDD